jgi:hypothetical protein
MLLSAIQKLIDSICNKEQLPDQWNESIIAPVHKKVDQIVCNNYRRISLLSTSHKIEYICLHLSSPAPTLRSWVRINKKMVTEDLSLDKPLHVIYKVSKLPYRI